MLRPRRITTVAIGALTEGLRRGQIALLRAVLSVGLGALIALVGCQARRPMFEDGWLPVSPTAPAPTMTANTVPSAMANTAPPRTLRQTAPLELWDMRLEESLQMALARSKVMADSGGRVLAAPATVQTVYDPAIKESDPLGGPMAALSAFDAQFTTNAFWRQGNNFNNNLLLGGGTFFLDTTQFVSDTAITKRAATGTTFRMDTNTEYFSSNAPYNAFQNLTSTSVGGEVRQPLLRGAGADFNRIAGSTGIAGAFNGIVLGRLNTDMSLIDFESSVRALLIDVERAYWDLSLSYRDLDAKVAARDATLETWRLVYRKLQVGMAGGDEETEARVREQYYVLQAQVENAYSGAPPVSAILGSAVGNAVVGNTAGVLGNERRLRLLLALPPTDHRLIRPITEPTQTPVGFDWPSSVTDALTRRAELRRQTLVVKKREAELSATRNLRLPQLDAVVGANYRDFNQDLSKIIDPTGPYASRSFNNTNYNAGLTFSMPLGNRQAHTAIRNAELQVARERALLREQELQVVTELSGAMVELDRAFTLLNTNANRRAAAQQQLSALNRKYEAGAASLDLVLDAQRRWSDAEAAYHRAIIDYNRAIADVHQSRGTLLDYDGVRLADAPGWQRGGRDSADLNRLRQEIAIDYTLTSTKRPSLQFAAPSDSAIALSRRDATAKTPTQPQGELPPTPGLLPPSTSPAASLPEMERLLSQPGGVPTLSRLPPISTLETRGTTLR